MLDTNVPSRLKRGQPEIFIIIITIIIIIVSFFFANKTVVVALKQPWTAHKQHRMPS